MAGAKPSPMNVDSSPGSKGGNLKRSRCVSYISFSGRTTMQRMCNRSKFADHPAHKIAPPIKDRTRGSGLHFSVGSGKRSANSRQAIKASFASSDPDSFALPVTNASQKNNPDSLPANSDQSRCTDGSEVPCSFNRDLSLSRIHATWVTPVASTVAPAPADQARFPSTRRPLVKLCGFVETGTQSGHSNPSATFRPSAIVQAMSSTKATMQLSMWGCSPTRRAHPKRFLATDPMSAQ